MPRRARWCEGACLTPSTTIVWRLSSLARSSRRQEKQPAERIVTVHFDIVTEREERAARMLLYSRRPFVTLEVKNLSVLVAPYRDPNDPSRRATTFLLFAG